MGFQQCSKQERDREWCIVGYRTSQQRERWYPSTSAMQQRKLVLLCVFAVFGTSLRPLKSWNFVRPVRLWNAHNRHSSASHALMKRFISGKRHERIRKVFGQVRVDGYVHGVESAVPPPFALLIRWRPPTLLVEYTFFFGHAYIPELRSVFLGPSTHRSVPRNGHGLCTRKKRDTLRVGIGFLTIR